jgi:hypothetical protein
MTTFRTQWLGLAAVLWAGFSTLGMAIPSPQQSSEGDVQPVSVQAGGEEKSLPRLQEIASAATSGPFANPFVAFAPSANSGNTAPSSGEAVTASASAPAPYPAGAPASPSSASSWTPTHFEIFGDVQWRNLTSNSGFSSSYCTPSGCVTNMSSFSTDVPLKKWGVGPDFGFLWTPDKEILGAKSRVWVEWEQLDRSNTRSISGSFTFNGVTYVVGTALKTELNTNLFSAGYSPQWGNEKFRIGPEVVFQRLTVNFKLTNLAPGAPPPITQDVDVPNFMAIIGLNFDYKPVQQLDVYGRSGWIPCCGGGWHGNQTEFGVKYYIRRNIGIIGGIRYYWLKRDFNLPAQNVTGPEGTTVTLGPFSGYVKFPGVGPFVGVSFRF